MEKRMRIICDFPESAPFFRVSAMVRELGKSGRAIAPAISMPDYDAEDPEQVALYNQLQQVGIPVSIPEQPPAQAELEQQETDAMREQWQAAMDQSKPETSSNPKETHPVDVPESPENGDTPTTDAPTE